MALRGELREGGYLQGSGLTGDAGQSTGVWGRAVVWSGPEGVSGAVRVNRDARSALRSLPLNGAEVTQRARWSVRVKAEVFLNWLKRIRLHDQALQCVGLQHKDIVLPQHNTIFTSSQVT